MAVSVTAKLPSARTAAREEKPEDKTKLDAEFKDRQQKLADKLTGEKKFEGWVYLLPAYKAEPWIKIRSQLLAELPGNQTEKTGNKAS
jgi:hypothetical protein